jgi:phosphatidate cytidylyltransferase
VAEAQPANEKPSGRPPVAGRSNLTLRIVSSLVLAPLAIAAAYFGGLVFAAFWAVAAIALIALGCFGAAALAANVRRMWCATGLVYAAALLIAPVLLRRDASFGFAAILFLFVIVWLTDSTAYFVGRAMGGPKLMPRVSPNKTWSGAIAGTVASMIGGVIVASGFGLGGLAAVAIVALVLSVISQVGDLAESAVKRQFNAKDASQLIPGHGGLMDRLDGFVAAAVAGVLIGTAHSGFDAPARGLMVW